MRIYRQLTVAEGVGHLRVELGHDKATSGPSVFNGCREHIHLNPQGDLPSLRHRSVKEYGIDGARRAEETRDQ